MKDTTIKLGEIIRKARIKKGLSQKQIFEEYGISQQIMSRYENDHAIPTQKNWKILCKVLDLPPDLLTRNPDDKTIYNFVKDEHYQQYLSIEPLVNEPLLIDLISKIKKEKTLLAEINLSGFLDKVSELTADEKSILTQSLKYFFNTIINQKKQSKKGK